MSEPRTRLDQAMTARSLDVGKRWVQIAREAGISTSALSGIRRGEYQPSPHTARRLEDALRWQHGSIEAILAGGEPTPAGAAMGDEARAEDSLTVRKDDEELRELFEDARDDPALREALLALARLREVRRTPPDSSGSRDRQIG